MYIPHLFRFEHQAELTAFMKQHSFASFITTIDQLPVATHLPFIVEERGGGLWLRSHLAKQNEQAAGLQDATALVIFSGPHAYISPKHYDKWESVPTWDYIAVHAYGKINVIEDEQAKAALLDQTIAFYEAAYQQRWDSLSKKYKSGMMQGLVAFELEVTKLQGAKKLSQNKTTEERDRIARELEASADSSERDLGKEIRQLA